MSEYLSTPSHEGGKKPTPYTIEHNGEAIWFIDDENGEPRELSNEERMRLRDSPEEADMAADDGVYSSETSEEQGGEAPEYDEDEEPVYPITGDEATPPYVPRPHAANSRANSPPEYDIDYEEDERQAKRHTVRRCLAGLALGATLAVLTVPYASNAGATGVMTKGNVQVSYGNHWKSMLEHYVNNGDEEQE